jgi:hypothetical protein
MTDLSDPRAVRKRNRDVRIAEKERREMILAIMAMPQGRRFVWDLLEKCHPFQTPFMVKPTLTAFNCGEANIGLWLIAEVQGATPDLYMQMVHEAGERNAGRRESDSSGSDGDNGSYVADDRAGGET